MKHEFIVASSEEIMKDRCGKYDFIDFDKSIMINGLPKQQKIKEEDIEKVANALNPLYQNQEDNFPIPKSKYHK